MIVMGLDISTTSTGVSVFKNGELQSSFIIQPEGKLMVDRFVPMLKGIIETIWKNNPDVIGIEDTYVGVDGNTVKFLTRLQGAVIGWCFENGKQYHTFVPNVWRSHLGFIFFENGKMVKRDRMKKQSMEYVKTHFDMDCKDDEADAICIGLFTDKIISGEVSLVSKKSKKAKQTKKIEKKKGDNKNGR